MFPPWLVFFVGEIVKRVLTLAVGAIFVGPFLADPAASKAFEALVVAATTALLSGGYWVFDAYLKPYLVRYVYSKFSK